MHSDGARGKLQADNWRTRKSRSLDHCCRFDKALVNAPSGDFLVGRAQKHSTPITD